MNAEIMRTIQRQAKSRIESLLHQCGDDTVEYLVGNSTRTALTAKAQESLRNGDYAGAILLEEAAKCIPDVVITEGAFDEMRLHGVQSKPMNNVKARLTVYQDFIVDEVDDMLCVVDQTVLRAGTYTVAVFHRDDRERVVGVKLEGFKNDLVVRIEERVVEIKYLGDNICARCGEEFTKKDIDGGRCLSCGSMIC